MIVEMFVAVYIVFRNSVIVEALVNAIIKALKYPSRLCRRLMIER